MSTSEAHIQYANFYRTFLKRNQKKLKLSSIIINMPWTIRAILNIWSLSKLKSLFRIPGTVTSMTLHLLDETYWTYQTPNWRDYYYWRDYIESGVAGASTALAVGAALAVVLQRYISTMPHLIAGLHNTVHLKALLLGALGFVSAVTICAITRHVCNNNDQKNQLLHLQVLKCRSASQILLAHPYIYIEGRPQPGSLGERAEDPSSKVTKSAGSRSRPIS
jgi:hypothetical protein